MSAKRKKVNIYLIEAKIQKQRLKDMKDAAKRRKICISEEFNSEVTHVVTEFKDKDSVLRKLDLDDLSNYGDLDIVSVDWFTDCMKTGSVVDVLDKHRINTKVKESTEESRSPRSQPMAEYACQRSTPLVHHNGQLTKALEVLELHAELRDSDHDYSRALAFRRASCVLKCLPHPLSSVHELRNLTHIGDHSRRVIQEILEDGVCQEIEAIVNDPWFHKMKLFTSVFGIGPSKAKECIEKGWSTIHDVKTGSMSKDWRVQWGLGFHDDLTTPVTRSEADYIVDIVGRHLSTILPGAIMEICGGFRRGKKTGHDVDILISHQTEGHELGVLLRLLRSLQSHDIVLCGKHEKSTYTDEVLTKDFKLSARGQLDHFEKWLGIVKVPKSVHRQISKDEENGSSETIIYRRTNTEKNSINGMKNSPEQKPSENCVTSENELLEDSANENLQEFDRKAQLRQNEESVKPAELSKEPHDWIARRVDLIISPYSQFYYSLVGWTGNKQFNRDIRTYAKREMNMKLTSHGLYDFNLGKKLAAGSEQEVFDNLKVPYRQPQERNC